MALYISSTSFLLPGNRQWASLAAQDVLNFGEYGDWFSALLSSDDESMLCMLFLREMIPDEALLGESADAQIHELLAPLRARLSNSDKPVIIAFSSWRQESPIRNARSKSNWVLAGRSLENQLYDLATDCPALHLLNMDMIWAQDGIATAFDARNLYAARCPLSSRGIERLATSAAAILARIRHSAKKVLVLDCDNTIWGGVVGEVGVEGLVLGEDGRGKAFVDFQRAARLLVKEGVLLALSSKNNEADAWAVFDHHPAMLIRREDIVAAKINWIEKSDNLRAMAEELDLGLSSFVFWDDNPLEREKMRLLCPEVTTPEVPADVGAWPDLLLASDVFSRFYITNEDRKKGDQYRNRAAFLNARSNVTDQDGFLKTIAMQPKAFPISAPTLARAEQLCAKTNQFNLRTVRHSAAELAALARENPDTSFLVELSDRFGQHGVIGLAIARQIGEVGFVDSFMMSCRVLGRHLEAWMMSQLVLAFKTRSVSYLLAEFIPSGRNTVAEGFLASYGFVRLDAGNEPGVEKLRELVAQYSFSGEVYFLDIEKFSVPFRDVFNQDPS